MKVYLCLQFNLLRDPESNPPAESETAPINIIASWFGFEVGTRLDQGGRTGVITSRMDIATPAFIPVGTKATVKAVRPDEVAELGGARQRYDLDLQPAFIFIDEGGGRQRLDELAGDV